MYAAGAGGLNEDIERAMQLYQAAADGGEMIAYFNMGALALRDVGGGGS